MADDTIYLLKITDIYKHQPLSPPHLSQHLLSLSLQLSFPSAATLPGPRRQWWRQIELLRQRIKARRRRIKALRRRIKLLRWQIEQRRRWIEQRRQRIEAVTSRGPGLGVADRAVAVTGEEKLPDVSGPSLGVADRAVAVAAPRPCLALKLPKLCGPLLGVAALCRGAVPAELAGIFPSGALAGCSYGRAGGNIPLGCGETTLHAGALNMALG
uniref:Uncharacterized protein n=1 Tax=Oryza rufipogon TaxID=4529 RepID=A0A0E0P0H9_ORYRU